MTTTSGKFDSVLRSTTHKLWEHSGAEKTRGGLHHRAKDPYGATPTPCARLLDHLRAPPPSMTRNPKPTHRQAPSKTPLSKDDSCGREASRHACRRGRAESETNRQGGEGRDPG